MFHPDAMYLCLNNHTQSVIQGLVSFVEFDSLQARAKKVWTDSKECLESQEFHFDVKEEFRKIHMRYSRQKREREIRIIDNLRDKFSLDAQQIELDYTISADE